MKPSRFRASSTFARSLEAGATQAACRLRVALRMRVSMSPRGSDIDIGAAPYQLALTMPGICPELASARSMFRDSLNLR